jgi:hypothetical protein
MLGNKQFAGQFGILQVLTLDTAANRYRLYELDGSVTEFDATSGMFRKFTAPGGNTIQGNRSRAGKQ